MTIDLVVPARRGAAVTFRWVQARYLAGLPPAGLERENMEADEANQVAALAIEFGLPSSDIASMRRFYCEGLGFRPCGTVDLPSAHIEGFRLGVHLVKVTIFTDEAQRPSPRPPSLQSPYVTIRVPDIRAVAARCAALGYDQLVTTSTAVTAGGRRVLFAFFADPMGNRVEIVEGDAWEPCG